MDTHLRFTRALVRNVLEDRNREWTVQGFGFLRTYFGPSDRPKMYRLNLWHSAFTVPNVSTIHDHPWDLTSLIVAGAFTNQRYELWLGPEPTHDFTTIKTGIGGGIEDSIQSCLLHPKDPEFYLPGDIYSQRANEIHETKFRDGSVTVNERIGDTERARVFWPHGTPWVDAIPRAATASEVELAVKHCFREWL